MICAASGSGGVAVFASSQARMESSEPASEASCSFLRLRNKPRFGFGSGSATTAPGLGSGSDVDSLFSVASTSIGALIGSAIVASGVGSIGSGCSGSTGTRSTAVEGGGVLDKPTSVGWPGSSFATSLSPGRSSLNQSTIAAELVATGAMAAWIGSALGSGSTADSVSTRVLVASTVLGGGTSIVGGAEEVGTDEVGADGSTTTGSGASQSFGVGLSGTGGALRGTCVVSQGGVGGVAGSTTTGSTTTGSTSAGSGAPVGGGVGLVGAGSTTTGGAATGVIGGSGDAKSGACQSLGAGLSGTGGVACSTGCGVWLAAAVGSSDRMAGAGGPEYAHPGRSAAGRGAGAGGACGAGSGSAAGGWVAAGRRRRPNRVGCRSPWDVPCPYPCSRASRITARGSGGANSSDSRFPEPGRSSSGRSGNAPSSRVVPLVQ